MIRTVLGDISPSELGVCYPHEHLLGAPPAPFSAEDFVLNDEETALKELQWFKEAGGRALVEMSTVDYNRNIPGLARLSAASGIHIVAATGFNKDRYSKHLVDSMSDEQLDAMLSQDVIVGIEGTAHRAGVLKAASTLEHISSTATRVFKSVARVHAKTGIPISTHTEAGTMALDQIELLTSHGVHTSSIIIGHIDRKLDWHYVLDVAQTGVFLGFDQISKEKYYPDNLRIEFILRLIDQGFGKQILLSGDLARRSYWPSYGGGPGFTYILWRFTPWLKEAGATHAQVQDLLVNNPARALSFD